MSGFAQAVFGLFYLLLGYAIVGAVFALPFAWIGVNAIDSEAKQSGSGFRLMILPGVVALWPLLAVRWVKHQQPPTERNAHRCSAR